MKRRKKNTSVGWRNEQAHRNARATTKERTSVDWDIGGAAVTVIWFMDMPSVFYAVRAMNTDRLDTGATVAPDRPEEIIDACASARIWLYQLRTIQSAATRSRRNGATDINVVREEKTIHLGFIKRTNYQFREDSRLLCSITIYVINRRFVSALPGVCINSRVSFLFAFFFPF